MDEREIIQPVRLTDNDTGKVYELDFSRDSVKFVEEQGYRVDETFDYPNKNIPKLFYYSFRKNHKNVSREQADKLRDKLGGLTDKIALRLVELYVQATNSNNVIQSEEDLAKNPHVTVEL